MIRLKTTRRGFLAGSAAIGAAGPLLGGWGRARAEVGIEVLKVREDADIIVLDPGYMIGGIEIAVQKQILPILPSYVRQPDDSYGWEPSWFARRLEWRDDTHIEFELQDFLTWSGGYGPVRASDVKYSYERMKTTEWGGYFDAMDHVEVTGERTGVIVMKYPFAPFVMVTLAPGPGTILCEAAMKDAGGKFTLDVPATCGPYTIRHVPGQQIIFKPDPTWQGPKPEFPEVVIYVIPEAQAGELAFDAGEVDVTEVSADALARYRGKMPDDARITVAGWLQYMWLGMNTENPKLQDLKVRRAIQHAVDVDAIVSGAYSGAVEESYGIVAPGLIGHRTDTKYYHYDPAKARELLEEAGVSDLHLTLRTLPRQDRLLTAQIIQANLGAVGITVEIIPLDSGPYWEMGMESKGETWKDLELWIMRFATEPDPWEASQWFVSDQVGVWNWERWTSEEYDRLYKAGMSTIDPAKRAEIYLKMQDIMEATGAYVWLVHEPEAYIHDDDIDIHTSPAAQLNYHLFERA